jgi:outer membrane protein TolC
MEKPIRTEQAFGSEPGREVGLRGADMGASGNRESTAAFFGLAVLCGLLAGLCAVAAHPPVPLPEPGSLAPLPPSSPLAFAPIEACDRPLPINLPTALKLANANPLDIGIAAERIRVATAQLDRASVLWLPTIFLGADYFRHDGRVQNVEGNIIDTSKSSAMVGAGPYAVFALTDALFSPLAARQTMRAREAGLQAATNDSVLAVAEAYFNVQQARGELAGALDTVRRAAELSRRAAELGQGLVPPLEAVRARTELARRQQAVESSRERWRTASADLTRILRLDRTALVQPLEPPHLRVTLLDPGRPTDDLVAMALTNRPELAGQQALVQATLQQVRQEKFRPFIPSVLFRGASTNPGGTLAGGYFGGGLNSNLSNFGARGDFDIQLLWELQNLGLGNRARIQERQAENQLATMELLRVQDRVMADVVQAHAQARSAAARVGQAETELKDAIDSVEKNFEGMGQTKRLGGGVMLLVIRPQEVVAAIQALAQAYTDYYGAIADYDRAQFRLYRAVGSPAQALAADGGSDSDPECSSSISPRPTFGQPTTVTSTPESER